MCWAYGPHGSPCEQQEDQTTELVESFAVVAPE